MDHDRSSLLVSSSGPETLQRLRFVNSSKSLYQSASQHLMRFKCSLIKCRGRHNEVEGRNESVLERRCSRLCAVGPFLVLLSLSLLLRETSILNAIRTTSLIPRENRKAVSNRSIYDNGTINEALAETGEKDRRKVSNDSVMDRMPLGPLPSDCPSEPLPVLRLPLDQLPKNELHHYFQDGLKNSRCLSDSEDFRLDQWVIDRLQASCDTVLDSVVRKLWFECGIANATTVTVFPSACTISKASWKVYEVFYDDSPDLRQPCFPHALEYALDVLRRNITIVTYTNPPTHYVYKRSMVEGRDGLDKLGQLMNYSLPVNHIPYGVRSDMIDIANDLVQMKNPNQTIFDNSTLEPLNPVYLERPGGVRHFWYDPIKGCRGFNCFASKTRTAVANMLRDLQNRSSETVKVGLAGRTDFVGRRYAQRAYVEEMMEFKITVVAQRDIWEDQYRLTEAFVGGGLVMTDPMLLPPRHLVDGKHYIVYHNMTDLEDKVLYYLNATEERLRVANAGWMCTMKHYRSWHMMEAMILRQEHLI